MDFSECIPVLCQAEGNFHGKSYWEKISSVVSHNGKSIDGPKTKSDFAEGDEVVIHFNGDDYRGVVKHSERLITTRSQSPPSVPPAPVQPEAAQVAGTADLPTTSSAVMTRTTPKKRRCAAKRKLQSGGSILPDMRTASGSTHSELLLMRGSPTIVATPMVTGHAGVNAADTKPYSGGGSSLDDRIRGNEVIRNLETRLMVDNLKSELNILKMEVRQMEVRLEMKLNREKQSDSSAITEILSKLSADIRNDLASLKQRQDLLFHKQDQIQCTLAGETPPVSNSGDFRSPSGSSVLAWSSVSPCVPVQASKPQYQTLRMEVAQQHVQPLQSISVPAEESSAYMYGFNDLTSLLDEDPYQSSLSDTTGDRSDLGTLLAETMSKPSPAAISFQPSQPQTCLTPRPAFTPRVDFPLSEPLVKRCPPAMHQAMTSSPSFRKQSLSQDDQPTPSVTLPASMTELLPPRKKTRFDLRHEDSGHSTSLKDPQVVVRKYADFANVADMGKLACMLARQCYFGDDVLKASTVHGKSAQYQALNPQKLSALLATIHELAQFREKSKQEFSILYMPKINQCLSRLCMNLRKM